MLPFIKCSWNASEALVTLLVKDYPEEGVTLEDIVPTIDYIRAKASSMIIRADLNGANLLDIDRFKSIVKVVSDVVEYTKDDNLLTRVEFMGAGVVFRMLYGPISLLIPKYFRDMVVFL